MFRLENVSKFYGSHQALDQVSFRLAPGKTSVLIGPSGCGKSTMIRLMTGLADPTHGQVFFGDQPLNPTMLPRMRRQIGYVIQEGGLFPHLTALGNVTLVARHIGWRRPQIERRVKELLALTRLPEEVLSRVPTELSGGQKQRVSLMRGLMLDPEVLLLDEPLGALDPLIRYDLQQDLLEIFRRLGKTVLLVTHDLREAAILGDTIVLMKDGRIVQQGTMADLEERPADPFVSRFLKAQAGLHDVAGSRA